MHTAYLVCGSPGAGKSVYAKRLATARRATVLDIDTVTERLVRMALAESGQNPDDRDSEHFKRTYRGAIYKTLFDIARENLPAQNVIIVGPFTQELRSPDWPSQLSKILTCPVEVHYVYCSPEIRRERLARRANPRDIEKLHDWQHHSQYYGAEEPPTFPHVFIDTSHLPEE